MSVNRRLLGLTLAVLVSIATLAQPAAAARLGTGHHPAAISAAGPDADPHLGWLTSTWRWLSAWFAGENGSIVPSPRP